MVTTHGLPSQVNQKKTWKLQQQPGLLISKGALAFLFLNSKNKPLVFHNSCQGNSDFSKKRNKGIFGNLNKKVRLMPNQKKFKFETQNHVFRFSLDEGKEGWIWPRYIIY